MDDTAIKPALYPASTEETDLKPSVQVGRDHIDLRPHESYEGAHRWDPLAERSSEEEARVVRKVDFYLLSWICLMFFGLQLDRGNISNALTDNMLPDLGLNTNDYNNVRHFLKVQDRTYSHLLGYHGAASLLPCGRVPSPALDQTLWLQANLTLDDDGMGHCLVGSSIHDQ